MSSVFRSDKWAALLKKVTETDGSPGRNTGISDADREKFLHDRAIALASSQNAGNGPGTTIDVLLFTMAAETYAFEYALVREVYPIKQICGLPGCPPFIVGIIIIRGRVTAITDLKKLFSLPDKGLSSLHKAIILENDVRETAILADDIIGIETLLESDLRHSSSQTDRLNWDFVKGISEEGVILLDADKILRDERILVNDNA